MGLQLRRETHLLFGVGTTLFFFRFLQESLAELIFIALLGSLIPDLDVRRKHRVLLHNVFSVFAFILITVFLFVYMGYTYTSAFAFALAGAYAYSTHLLLDSFTNRGIRLLWPISNKWYGLRSANYDDPLMNTTFSIIGAFLLFFELMRSTGLLG